MPPRPSACPLEVINVEHHALGDLGALLQLFGWSGGPCYPEGRGGPAVGDRGDLRGGIGLAV